MAILRTLLWVSGLAGAAYVAGRDALDRAIETRKQSAIDIAKERARLELDRQVGEFVSSTLRRFAYGLVVKALLLVLWGVGFAAGLIGPIAFSWGLVVLLALFLLRDLVVTLPTVLPALKHIHAHGWRLRRALTEMIAGAVFEQAYAEALEETKKTRIARFAIALSRTSPETVSGEVAEAVAALMREMSYATVRARVLVGLAKAAVLLAAYSGLIFMILRLRN